MEILTKEQEESLQRIIEQSNVNINKAGRVDINCTANGFERTIIDFLIQNGYLKSLLKENNVGIYAVIPTEDGKNYFNKKSSYQKAIKEHERKERKEKIVGWVRWGVTTAIAISALFTSIFLK